MSQKSTRLARKIQQNAGFTVTPEGVRGYVTTYNKPTRANALAVLPPNMKPAKRDRILARYPA